MNFVHHVASQEFNQEVIQSSVPVLVDFYADWCGPCRMLSPTLDKLAQQFSGQVKFAKVNVDDSGDLAQQFQVESIPTLIVVQNGKVIGRTSGLVSETALRQAMNQLVNSPKPTGRRAG